MKTKEKNNKIGLRQLLRILFIKWIKGSCHHMCAFCEYRHECLEHFEG